VKFCWLLPITVVNEKQYQKNLSKALWNVSKLLMFIFNKKARQFSYFIESASWCWFCKCMFVRVANNLVVPIP